MKTNRKYLVAACALAAVFTFAAPPPCAAGTSPYVESSFWMADPLRPNATWWRDTGNQNAIAQYWQDQCLGRVLNVYSSADGSLNVYMYSAKTTDGNVAVITTPTSYFLVGFGGSEAGAEAAKAAFTEYIPGFADKQLVGAALVDGPSEGARAVWGADQWDPTGNLTWLPYPVLYIPGSMPYAGLRGTPVQVYVNAGWNDFMQGESALEPAVNARGLAVDGSLLSTGPDGYLGPESWPTNVQSQISPTVQVPADVSSSADDGLGNTVTFNCATFILFDSETGKKNIVQLYPVMNNSDPTLLVWLPEHRVLIAGAPFQECFPGCGSLTGRPVSPTEMISAYNEMFNLPVGTSVNGTLTLNGNPTSPNVLVYLHALPLTVAPAVVASLNDQKGALNSLLTQTVSEINAGVPLDQIVTNVAIPAAFASSPFVQPYLTDVPTAVKDIYDYYLGWFHNDPLQLTSTLTSADKAQMIANLAGGVGGLISAAKNAELAATDSPDATGSTGLPGAEQALFLAQTAYHAAQAENSHLDQAKAVYAQALVKCAYMQQSSQIRNYYLTLANQLVSGQ